MALTRPKWAQTAKNLLDSGKSTREVGKILGLSDMVVCAFGSDNWQAYALKYAAKSLFEPLGIKVSPVSGRPSAETCKEFVKNNPEMMEVLMAERSYKEVKLTTNGVSRFAVRIECSKQTSPDCLRHEDFSNVTGNRTSPTHASIRFRKHGWLVGGGPRADICPKCNTFNIEQRRNKTPTSTLIKVEEVKEPAPQKAVMVEKKVEATIKDIDRTSKRVIDAKLDEVYDAKKGGYLDGYNDAKLSQELGVDKLWVALVRDFGHGPETSAEDTIKAIEIIKKIAADVREDARRIEVGIARLEEFEKELNTRIMDFEKHRKHFEDKVGEFNRKVS